MTQNVEHLIHKKSKVVNNGAPKSPSANSVELGEIAVNYANGHETLFVKNDLGNVISFPNSNVVAGSVPTKAAVQKFTSGEDSGKTFVYFYNANQSTSQTSDYLFRYDATDFVIDGMIETVQITSVTSGESTVQVLEFVFNTDSGKQKIDIPLTDLFNPANLSSDTSSNDGSYVVVRVVQTAGKISEVHVNDSGITNSFGSISGDCSSNGGNYVTVKTSQENGKITAITVNDSAVTNSFSSISGDCSSNGGNYVTVKTSQENGLITAITVNDSAVTNSFSSISGVCTGMSDYVSVETSQANGLITAITVTDSIGNISSNTSANTDHISINVKENAAKITAITLNESDIASVSKTISSITSTGNTINLEGSRDIDQEGHLGYETLNIDTSGNLVPIFGFTHDPSNATSAYTNTSAVTSSSGYPSVISGATLNEVKINTALQQLEKAIIDIWKLLGKNTFDKDDYGRTLYDIIVENERVTSAALIDLNNRLSAIENS